MAATAAHAARTELEQRLKLYWQQRYAAYQQKGDEPPPFLGDYHIPFTGDGPAMPPLPTGARDAYTYYQTTVEAQDWGSVGLYRMPWANGSLYVVRVTTDGDDGWLELYDAQGHTLGVGRTNLEVVAWGHKAAIRSQVASGAFPPTLTDAASKSLWGK